LPKNLSVLTDGGGQIVCLAGKGKTRNIRLAEVYAKSNKDGRCRVSFCNREGTSCVLDWENVFGVVLKVEELENNGG
jgi:hypothetical protein